MRLRAVHIENWRCIRKLALQDFSSGITVLHGPNGTGKSSLVAALRCCLFDFAHDTRNQSLLQNRSWSGQASPRIAVEWERDGRVWRVRKMFSTLKDGESILEEWCDGQWVKRHEGAREVADRLRDLLGAENSKSGFCELLWLEQGAVHLPKQLGGSLQQQLLHVLGSLITSRDRVFGEKLETRLEKWFTRKKREHRTGERQSPVARLEKDQSKLQEELEKLQTQLRDMEQVIRSMSDLEEDLPRIRAAAADADQSLLRLQQEHEKLKDRLHDHRLVLQRLETAKKHLSEAQHKFQERQAAADRLAQSQARTEQARQSVAEAQHRAASLAQECERQQDVLRDHEAELEKSRAGLADFEDQRRYLGLQSQTRQLAELVETVQQMETEMQNLHFSLAALPVPDADALRALRENRRQAQELESRLAAAALQLRIEPSVGSVVLLQCDLEASREQPLQAGTTVEVEALHRFHLKLPGWGELTVVRKQPDGDLEKDAHDLAELHAAFARTLKAYDEDPDSADSLERLHERRLHREHLSQRLALLQENVRALAPQGLPSIVAQLRKLAEEQSALVRRRPYLETWEPKANELEKAETIHRGLMQQSEKQLQALKATFEKQKTESKQAEAKLLSSREVLLTAEALTLALQDECGRFGEPARLAGLIAQAEAEVRGVQEQVQATRLLPEEEGLELRLGEAAQSVKQKRERVRQSEDELVRLRGRMEGSEGLHLKLADAEAALQTCRRRAARERLDADAHRLLYDLYTESRENQVQLVMGPIAERVHTWARQLGLHDLPTLRFTDQFLPDGLIHPQDSAETLALQQESYGIAEQLALLVRLALGGVLTAQTPALAVLDDPLAHTDALRRCRFMEILYQAVQGDPSAQPPAGPLQVLILTCHPEWFDGLPGVLHHNLAQLIERA